MAALSHHSSNPMEGRLSHCVTYTSSDDPLDEYPDERLDKYRKQVAELMAEHAHLKGTNEERMVDLDDSDELQAFDEDDTPRKEGLNDDEEMEYEEYDEDLDVDGEPLDTFADDDSQVMPRNNEEGDVDEDMEMEWGGPEDEGDEPEDVHRTSDDIDCFALDESEEAQSIKSKPPEEQAEIKQEMQDFKAALPELAKDYKLIDRLGTGTFSSVYKAIDRHYHEWDNAPWHGYHPPESSAHYQSLPHSGGARVFVAIKRIYVTSGPDRIKNELLLMEHCRGCRHVSQVITAFRHEDQVAIVMPYHRNADFREYFQELPMAGVKEYFRCLMRALRDIHRRGIIHRDVKPANFLFDPRTGQGALCDFGLAQRFDRRVPAHGSCLHINANDDFPHGKYIHKNDYNVELVKKQQSDARWKNRQRGEMVGYPDKDSRVPMKANRAGTRGFRAPEVLLKCGQQSGAVDVWSAGIILLFFLTYKFPLFQASDDIEALMEVAAIIGKSKMEKVATLHCRTFASNVPDIPSEEVTWREFTTRLNPGIFEMPPPNFTYYPYTLPSYKLRRKAEAVKKDGEAKEGGQVSMMAVDQPPTLSIDVASGNPLLSSTGSSPLTPLSDASFDHPPAAATTPATATTRKSPLAPLTTTASVEATYQKDVEDALSLLEQLLQPESVKRITPREALYHPFLLEKHPSPTTSHFPSSSSTTTTTSTAPDGPATPTPTSTTTAAPVIHPPSRPKRLKGDDVYEPHPFGHGVCSALHFVDAVTEQPGVIIRVKKCVCGCGNPECCDGGSEVEELRKLVSAGEGLSIGDEPCEFHRDMVWA